MARPRADNYEQRRQEILDTAAAMFAERGYDGTSIADIAQRCGVSKALLYHYHPSKDRLLYDMLQSHCQLLVDTATTAIKKNDPADRQLQQLVRALMKLYMSSRDQHIVLLNNLHCLPEAEQAEIKGLEKQVLHLIKEIVSELRPDLADPMRSSLAMYLMGAINWTYTWFKTSGPFTPGQFADVATGMFLNGILNDTSLTAPAQVS